MKILFSITWTLPLIGALGLAGCSNDAKFSSETTTTRYVSADSLPADSFAIEQIFSTGGLLQTEKFAFTVQNDQVAQDVTLTGIYSDLNRSIDQVDRALNTKLYKQGAGGKAISEQFDQAKYGIVDILVVIDTSGSMAEEQNNLATRLDPLLSEISNSDWQIGVVTTDSSDPCLRAVIKRGQTDAAQAFRTAVTAGVSGSGNEEGVRRAVSGLGCTTPAWLRPDASIAILYVTDEDNCSSQGSGCGSNPWAQPSYLTSYIKNTLKRELGKTARVYGIYWIPGDTTCTTGYNQGVQYKQLIDQSGGAGGSICATDYSPTLKAISKNISTILKVQFPLQDAPTPGTLTVKINGVEKTTGFSVTNNVLTFTDTPPLGAKIAVDYFVGREPQLKEFALGEAPASGTLSVTVNNNAVNPGDYTVDTSSYKLVFTTPPPSSSDIKIVFRSNVPLIKEVDIGKKAVQNTIKVTINGTATNDFVYDLAAGVVRFNVPPPDLAKIMVGFKNLNPILSYDLYTVGANPNNFTAVDKETDQSVRISFKNGVLQVHADDHADKKVIIVRYDSDEFHKKEVKLAGIPLDSSLRFEVAPVDCNLENGIAIEGDVFKLNCDLPTPTNFEGAYDYKTEIVKSFTVGAVSEPEKGLWLVLVNGEKRDDFVQEGNTIRFDGDLPRDAQVAIRFYLRPNE